MSKEQQIIVGTFRGGQFIPHIMCSDDVEALEGQQVALSVMTSEPDKVRTHQERKAIEVYCREAARVCSSAGIVTDKNESGNYVVDGNDLALSCAPTVDLINT